MAAWLMGSGAGFVDLRPGRERARWGWLAVSHIERRGGLVGAGALLLGVILRGAAAGTDSSSPGWLPLSRVGDRAALVALMAGLLSLGLGWRPGLRQGRAVLIPGAILAGISAFGWPVREPGPAATAALLMSVCTLVAAGLAVWSAGQSLDVLVGDRQDNVRAAAAAFTALTLSVLVVGGTNWRVRGTPGGTSTAAAGLMAVWLVEVARFVLGRKSDRLASALDLTTAAVLVAIALRVQWALPFGA
jgi:hypothetical protein